MNTDDPNLQQQNQKEVVKEEKKEKGHEKKEDAVEQLENRIKGLEDQLKRAVADYRNLERRSFEEKSEAVRYANKQLIESLLPAFDTLFLAERYTTDESIKLTVTRVLEILKENGIEKVAVDDAKYNAQTMEVVEVVDGEKGKIIEEIRPGFTIYGKLIRPAQVKVGKDE